MLKVAKNASQNEKGEKKVCKLYFSETFLFGFRHCITSNWPYNISVGQISPAFVKKNAQFIDSEIVILWGVIFKLKFEYFICVNIILSSFYLF